MKSLGLDRRGSAGLMEICIGSIIGIFLLGTVSIFVYLINSSFFDEFNDTGFNNTATGQVESKVIGGILLIDWIIVLLVILAIVSCAAYGYNHPESPITFLSMFLFAPFLGLMSYMFNYVFHQIIYDTTFASVINYYPNTVIICTNLHWFALAMIMVGGYTVYTSRRQSVGGFVE